jgi:two-component system, LytTR family, sensor kinase
MTANFKSKFVTWLSFTLLWLFVSFFMLVIYYDTSISIWPQLGVTFLGTLLTIPASWYAATRLVPQFLYKKKIKGFIWRVLALTVLNVIVIYLVMASIYYTLTGKPVLRNPMIIFMIVLLSLFVNLIFTSIGCGVKIIADRYSLEQRLLETEKEKISAELNFLRSQINPHFLFNVLNTIYFQIDKSNELARASVEKFSEMLRYQLYDCNTDKIEIKKEIEYIQSYVVMQSLRLEAGTDIQLCTGERLEGFSIAPFMFLTLIENAFKHISHFKNPEANKIHIDIRNNENILVVKVSNTFDKGEKVQHLQQSGGMGIQNLKRRIELLYPEKAQLSVYKNETIFESVLNIQCHD